MFPFGQVVESTGTYRSNKVLTSHLLMKTQSASAGTKKAILFAQTKNAQGKLAHLKKENEKENEIVEIIKRIEMH